jgi:hypothetical protein
MAVVVEVASMVVAAAAEVSMVAAVVASMVGAVASVAAAEASMAAAASVAAVLLADTLEAEHTSMVAEHASRVEDRVFQVEAGILWPAALASRHLGCVRRQRSGRMPLPAIGGSQIGQMLHRERLTIAEIVSELSGTDGRRLRAFNQDASIARTSTGETTSSRATTVIGIAIGIGAVPIIGITTGGVLTAVPG